MRFRFDVSLYIIVPVIFAGLAALTSTGSFRLTAYLIHRGAEPGWPLLAWTLLMTGAGFACGLVIVRLFLKPVSEFVEKARRLTPLEAIEADPVPDEGGDEVRRYSRVFDRVTRVLSRVDARQQFPEIIGQSRAMRAVLAQIVKVAPTDGTVLIQGESGTGKELVATSICQHSLRQGRPFIKLNCVAIPEGLLESELFGHEKGAFTGATSTQKGRFELADGGTLFLDEIGDMPLETQAKILRVLQEREFEPVGGSRTIKVDVRFIAATNKNLDDLVSQGRF
ncbi:MAG: sigma-54 factor interaction domain-containing protein, partial [Proteobacteria bacterium]|nr:sigma-54 factor interaction domain-containing protein [Pseudomonadota bacterium]